MKTSLLALLGGASTALAAVKGYNYGSQGQTYDTFANQFRTAASLAGATDFTSARLYTMIQDGTTNGVTTAIQAALDTSTTLLLGLWASTDQAGFNNELAALKTAIGQFGERLGSIAVGISVGSEDLYRISPTGIAANSGYGQSPDVLVNYIGQVRDTIRGTALANVPVGHVDTWNVYVNTTNAPVISAVDWLGLDEYPYYQTTDPNSIDNAQNVFFQSYDRVAGVAGGKPIWITEAGWPTAGPTSGQAIASVQNAETFWQQVSCQLQSRNINTWWYILADAGASPSFGVSNNGQPLYDLTCHPVSSSSSSPAASSSASLPTSPDTGAGSGASSTAVATTGGSTSSLGAPVGVPTSILPTATPSITTSVSRGPVTSSVVASTTSRTGGSSTTAAASPTTSPFNGGATNLEGPVAGLIIAAAIAAFAL